MTDGTDAVRVTSTLTPKGYRAVLLHMAALRLRFVVTILAFLGFGALGAGFDGPGFFIFIAMIGVVITVWGYIAWNVSSPSRIELYEPVAYEFGPDAIVYASPSGAGEIPWSRIPRWRYAAGHYLLYVTGASYLLVPESCVDAEDIDRLEAVLRERIRKGPKRTR